MKNFAGMTSILASTLVLLPAFLVAGCGSHGLGPTAAVTPTTALAGNVHGGQQPIGAALLQIYAVGSTGDGSAATPLISTTVTTSDGTSNSSDSNANAGNDFNQLPVGSFSIPVGAYTCPVGDPDVYIVATGGNPGLSFGTDNTASALMAALGPCNGLSATTNININEITTVGSIVPVSAWMTSYTALGSGSGDAAQLTSALAEVNEYINTSVGTTPGPALPAGYSVPVTALQTLADILAGCINTSGGVAGDPSICGQLFTLATPPSGTAPTDTIGALINIENNPTQNVSQIYDLLGAVVPFPPTLTMAPSTWALPITSGNATQLAFQTGPSNTASGTSISPAVTVAVEDASGNVQTSATNTVTLSLGANPSSGTLSGTVTANAINGIATFANLSIDKGGTGYTLVASGTGLTTATSASFNVTAGTATKLSFTTQPSSTSSGSSISPAVAVSVEDASGNVVTTSTVAVTMAIGTNPGSGTLSGTVTVDAISGVATFSNLSINSVANGYKLAATSGSLTSATSASFNITGAAIHEAAAVVGNNLITNMAFSLPSPAPATESMTVTSSDPTHVLLSSSATAVGATSITVQLTQGSTSIPTIYIQGQNYSGTTAINATITASAAGFADGTGTASVYPSGLVFYSATTISTTTFSTPPSLPSIGLVVLTPGTLTLAAESQPLNPGASPVTFTVTSGTPATGTITGTPPAFTSTTSWDLSSGLTFQPLAAGTTTLTLNEPAGYYAGTTSSFTNTLAVTVTAPQISVASNTVVGNNFFIGSGFSIPAGPPTAETMTITSSDPTHFLLSTSSTAIGSGSITVPLTANSTALPSLYVEGLNYTGTTAITATLTATANGYTTGTGTLTLYPSGVGFYTASFNTTTSSTPTSLTLSLVVLNPGTLTLYAQGELGAQGASPNVTVVSGTPATGTITGNPVTFSVNGNPYGSAATFQPVAAGTSTLSITEPTGYSVPNSTSWPTSITATVAAPNITISAGSIVGNNFIGTLGINLQAPPSASEMMTLTSSDPTHFLLSSSPTATGSASIMVQLTKGSTSIPAVYLEGLNYSGTTAINVTITASADGFNNGTGSVALWPSGVGFYNTSLATTTFASPSQLTISLLVLEPGTLTVYTQGSLGPQATNSPSVTVVSGTPATGTITGNPAVFTVNGSTYSQNTYFQPVGAGTSLISFAEPTGYSVPASASWPTSFTATVTAPDITSNGGGTIVGNNLIVNLGLGLQTAPTTNETMTITSNDPTHFLLSTSLTGAGSPSVTVALTAGYTNVPTVYVLGQNFNNNATAWTTTFTASAPGYTTDTGSLTLYPSGVIFYSASSFSTKTTSSPTTLETAVYMLNPGTLTTYQAGVVGPQAVGGVSFTVTSGTPATGTISGSPATIPVGQTSNNTLVFTPLAVGTSVLTINQPTGFNVSAGPTYLGSDTATVTGP